MKILGKYTLLLPGEGWNTNTDGNYITYNIHFDMRNGITEILISKRSNTPRVNASISLIYESPVRFVYDFCQRYGKDIRDYTDITELEPGVERLLYCYLSMIYKRMIDQIIDNKGDHDGGNV